MKRIGSVLGLAVGVAGLPLVLQAVAGPPSLSGLPTWAWVRDGLRDQYLPVDPLLHAMGLLAWGLWAYVALVVVLRAVAVLAAHRRLAGATALLAVTNLVTVPALRSMVDAAVGVSLLASTVTPPTPATIAAPAAVVRTVEAPSEWDRARPLLDTARAEPSSTKPVSTLASAALWQPERYGPRSDPDECAPAPSDRLYTVEPGDSLWRIAERELGDPYRWGEIFALNRGRHMPDGAVFRNAGLIRPGWRLYLPPRAAPSRPAPAPAPTPTPGEQRPPPSPKREPAPPTSTAPSSTAPSSTAPATTTREPAAPPTQAPETGGRDVLDLPSGSLVGFTLAAGIALALALVRLRRRARRRLGRPDDLAEPGVGDTTRRLARFAHQRTAAPALADEPDEDHDGPPPPPPRAPFAPSDLHTIHPGRVVVADRDGEELAVDLVGFGAIAITGEPAADASRAAVLALLSSGNPFAAQVFLASADLLAGVEDFPGLQRIPDLASALDAVERELLGRARLFESYGVEDFTAMRRERPDDQQPALLLVTDQPPGEQAGRLAALLAQGPGLGVGALLVGTTLDGAARIGLDDSGRVEGAAPRALSDTQLVGARVLRLTEADAVELLGVLAASRIDPAEQHPVAVLAPVTEFSAAPPPARPMPEPVEPPPAPPPRAAAPKVRVRLLGAYRIQTTTGGEVRTGLRRKAREALAYCLLHPDGRSSEQVIDTVFPEVDPARGPQRFWNAMTNLRSVLRQATGVEDLPAVERIGPAYRPDPEVFEVDVWQVQAALAAAHQASDPNALLGALQQVAAGYTGTLLETPAYEWAELHREELRRQVVDALARLAELHHKAGNPEQALVVLEQAIGADPYAEELYQRVMHLQADLGRPDAVRRTFRTLERRLDELELDPNPATEQLLAALLRRSTTSNHLNR